MDGSGGGGAYADPESFAKGGPILIAFFFVVVVFLRFNSS